MGNGVAAIDGVFSWSIASLSLLTALLLQIMSNLANDYGDSIHGADNTDRVGPTRAVQSGLLASEEMKSATMLIGLLAFVSGLSLLWIAFTSLVSILSFTALGVLAIWAAYNYTAGDRPYGYAGLGDLSVYCFFGLVAVLGCYVLQTQEFSWWVLLPATTCGLLSVGVLNVNNMRDITSDHSAGKRSIPVIIGLSAAKVYHILLVVIAWICLLIYTNVKMNHLANWSYVVLMPLFLRHLYQIWKSDSPQHLDPKLKQLALSTAGLIIAFLVGFLAV